MSTTQSTTTTTTANPVAVLNSVVDTLFGPLLKSHTFNKGLGIAAFLVGIVDPTGVSKDAALALIGSGAFYTAIVHWVQTRLG